MEIFQSFFSGIDLSLFVKLLLAMLLGLLVGLERTVSRRMAGMRTYALVSMGSCLLIIISTLVTIQYLGQTAFDPMRMAAGIVMGIGFLCGGLIVFQESKLLGLTTAAGMWVATGIGIAVGFGFYSLAIFTTLITLFVLHILWPLEQDVKKIANHNSETD